MEVNNFIVPEPMCIVQLRSAKRLRTWSFSTGIPLYWPHGVCHVSKFQSSEHDTEVILRTPQSYTCKGKGKVNPVRFLNMSTTPW